MGMNGNGNNPMRIAVGLIHACKNRVSTKEPTQLRGVIVNVREPGVDR